jgi:type IV pilus assembly protein PilA
MKTFQSPQRGFSLIELLIVVAIIGIIAAIAIPFFLSAKQAAKEASAVQCLRTIHGSQASYRTVHGDYTDLVTLNTEHFLDDPALSAGTKSDYQFVLTLPASSTPAYQVTAEPLNAGTGKYFYIDASGVIRFAVGSAATVNSPPID